MGLFGSKKYTYTLGQLVNNLKKLFKEYFEFNSRINSGYTTFQKQNMIKDWFNKNGVAVYQDLDDGYGCYRIRYVNTVHIDEIMTVRDASREWLYVGDEYGNQMTMGDYLSHTIANTIKKAYRGMKVRVVADIWMKGRQIKAGSFDDDNIIIDITISRVKISIC